MLERVLETEAMDTPAEAEDYDRMDHSEVNRRFAADFMAAGGDVPWVVDVGAGTALIPLELCSTQFSGRVIAVDSAWHMLRVGARNVNRSAHRDRIALLQVDARRLPFADGSVPAVCSNSIVHHIPRPLEVLRESWRVLEPGGLFFYRDLFRPESEDQLAHLVAAYAGKENDHQQQMFADSLRAALRVEEMQQLASAMDISPATVRATSDRHWTWCVRKPRNG